MKINLLCYMRGDDPQQTFEVEIDKAESVAALKKRIKDENGETFRGVDARLLLLWGVCEPFDQSIKEKIEALNLVVDNALQPPDILSDVFPPELEKRTVHIVVDHLPVSRTRSPVSQERPPKRLRLNSAPPFTPPAKIQVETVEAKPSPRLTHKETEVIMAAALDGFEQYIEYLATGKLDGYLDSIRREDKVQLIGVDLPRDPILLIHDLGKYPDQERIRDLFIHDTVHLFSVSGSGKTRLCLDGLCQHWGLYISCRTLGGPASGSDDFDVATKMLKSMSTWDQGISSANISKNAEAAHRAFVMLICARVFILKQLVQHLPVGTNATLARRRWILAQILPPHLAFQPDDLFVKVLRDLRGADTMIMLRIIRSTLFDLTTKRRDLFPGGSDTPLFVVIDEAQVPADDLKDFFRSGSGEPRPVLREMYGFFKTSGLFAGIILSGTGLSMKMVKDAVGSFSSKKVNERKHPRVFTDIGRFTRDDSSQMVYIRRYLGDISDQRLLERMAYWFSGRYRLTASLIELFLYSENVPRHRVLTLFAEHLTGFKITDAIDLEDGEPPVSPDLSSMIEFYRPLTELDRLFTDKNIPNREELIQCLVDALMRWTLGSETTSIPIERNMHSVIAAGVGFLNRMESTLQFNPNLTYPVYISEPLVVLTLSSLFEKQTWTTRQTWMVKSLRNAPNSSSLGFTFEVGPLLVLMENFWGKFNPLADAFHCSSSLGSRKVTLVSLKRGTDGILRSCPVSWNAGNSDHLGFKAKSPAEVLDFLNDPDGKAFLFPDTHMGPDMVCFLQDEKTKELIILAMQIKTSPRLNPAAWQKAILSVTPQFLYTMVAGEERVQYAPVLYPNLINDLTGILEMILGKDVFRPVADTYCSKLRSSTRAHQQSASHPTRQTPRYLRVIVTPDDQQKHLEGKLKDDVAVLRWDVVRDYIGSTADLVKGVVF